MVSVKCLSCPKRGYTQGEYEDAFAPDYPVEMPEIFEPLRVAIADGASESSFADIWAKFLVEAFVEGQFEGLECLKKKLPELALKWEYFVKSKELPWYAEEKARMGAFSTLMGLNIKPAGQVSASENGCWTALAVGDSCLFHIRDNRQMLAYPLDSSRDFNISPYLFSSKMTLNEGIWNKVNIKTGIWKKGDVFILLTDAIAAWFLKETEQQKKPWEIIFKIFMKEEETGKECFDKLVAGLHEQSMIRNDDVTCMLVQL